MGITNRLHPEVIRVTFNHIGLYAGIVPVYLLIEDGIDYTNDVDAVLFLTERNWVPSGSVRLVQYLWKLLTIFYPSNPPVFVTGEIVDSEV